MDARDQTLEVGVLDDEPFEAEVVGRDAYFVVGLVEVEQLFDVRVSGEGGLTAAGLETESRLT